MSTWRASQILQLVHADICGPITPISNSKKRLKYKGAWVRRQLTASYTPQHNGVAERKNRTIMNIRSMLSEKKIPKIFWLEAVNWTVHVLNRSPTFAVKNQTPEEAWSGVKPTVEYFKVFGCVSHVHVLDSKRTKLDDKSLRCVLLGVSEESKAYRLYDPVSHKILVSRDIVFEEDKSWDWDKRHEEVILVDLE
ncbi:unnamed protein product [Prunus armeniaca]